tara:strand:- start:22 stop:168 length:147 start_codon:yes stop_codon:yes gene_type:complete
MMYIVLQLFSRLKRAITGSVELLLRAAWFSFFFSLRLQSIVIIKNAWI